MTTITLSQGRTALDSTIGKWEDMAAGKETDLRYKRDPLCEMYWNDACVPCPIWLKTKKKVCRGTPFIKWRDHHVLKHPNEDMMMVHCRECEKLARKQIRFLRGLKP